MPRCRRANAARRRLPASSTKNGCARLARCRRAPAAPQRHADAGRMQRASLAHLPRLVEMKARRRPWNEPEAHGPTGMISSAAWPIATRCWATSGSTSRFAGTTQFNADFRDLVTRHAWLDIWGRRAGRGDAPPAGAGYDHGRGALGVQSCTARPRRAGVPLEKIRETLMQGAIYCGVPAANTAFKVTTEDHRDKAGCRQPAPPPACVPCRAPFSAPQLRGPQGQGAPVLLGRALPAPTCTAPVGRPRHRAGRRATTAALRPSRTTAARPCRAILRRTTWWTTPRADPRMGPRPGGLRRHLDGRMVAQGASPCATPSCCAAW